MLQMIALGVLAIAFGLWAGYYWGLAEQARHCNGIPRYLTAAGQVMLKRGELLPLVAKPFLLPRGCYVVGGGRGRITILAGYPEAGDLQVSGAVHGDVAHHPFGFDYVRHCGGYGGLPLVSMFSGPNLTVWSDIGVLGRLSLKRDNPATFVKTKGGWLGVIKNLGPSTVMTPDGRYRFTYPIGLWRKASPKRSQD